MNFTLDFFFSNYRHFKVCGWALWAKTKVTIQLDNLSGLFQPKWYCDSIYKWNWSVVVPKVSMPLLDHHLQDSIKLWLAVSHSTALGSCSICSQFRWVDVSGLTVRNLVMLDSQWTIFLQFIFETFWSVIQTNLVRFLILVCLECRYAHKNCDHTILEMVGSEYILEKKRQGKKRVHFFLDFFRNCKNLFIVKRASLFPVCFLNAVVVYAV